MFRRGFRQMGDLPRDIATERGDLPLNNPVGYPPPGSGVSMPPTAYGQGYGPAGDTQATQWNQSQWQSLTFTATGTAQKVQDTQLRKFLIIQNKSALETMLIGFGWIPVESNALILPAGLSYEPFTYPTNEIYIRTLGGGSADGLIIFGV